MTTTTINQQAGRYTHGECARWHATRQDAERCIAEAAGAATREAQDVELGRRLLQLLTPGDRVVAQHFGAVRELVFVRLTRSSQPRGVFKWTAPSSGKTRELSFSASALGGAVRRAGDRGGVICGDGTLALEHRDQPASACTAPSCADHPEVLEPCLCGEPKRPGEPCPDPDCPTRPRCSWTSASECAMARERAVAGTAAEIPTCQEHEEVGR